MATECGDRKIVLFQYVCKLIESLVIVQQNIGIGVRFSRISAATDLDRLYSARSELVRGVGQRNIGDNIRKNTEFHIKIPPDYLFV